jgi:hypothetical protein
MEFAKAAPWLKGIRSRSADVWLSVIRPLFIGRPEDQAKIDDLGKRTFITAYPDTTECPAA